MPSGVMSKRKIYIYQDDQAFADVQGEKIILSSKQFLHNEFVVDEQQICVFRCQS